MGNDCRFCGKPILDDERITDRFHVTVEFHRACINTMLEALGAHEWVCHPLPGPTPYKVWMPRAASAQWHQLCQAAGRAPVIDAP